MSDSDDGNGSNKAAWAVLGVVYLFAMFVMFNMGYIYFKGELAGQNACVETFGEDATYIGDHVEGGGLCDVGGDIERIEDPGTAPMNWNTYSHYIDFMLSGDDYPPPASG